MNVFQNAISREINASVVRYCEYCLSDIKNSYVVISENGDLVVYKNSNTETNKSVNSFVTFWKSFIEDPEPVFIAGHTETLRREVDEEIELNYENIRKFKYLYELFPEICGYVSAPFNPGVMRIEKEKIHNLRVLLKSIEKLYSDVVGKLNTRKKFIKNDKLLQELSEFFENGWKYFGVDPEEREAATHRGPEEDQGVRNLKIQVANLIAGFVRIKTMEKGTDEKLKLLLIDNRPDRPLEEIDQRFKGIFSSGNNFTIEDVFAMFNEFIDTYIYDDKPLAFKNLVNELKKAKGKKKPEIKLSCRKSENKDNYTIENLSTFHFILVDMYLGKDSPDGIEILHHLTDVFPHIPAFVLSISDDFEVMHRATEAGADYYIIKNQTFSVPYAYCKYLENIGSILKYLENKEYEKDLLGNIRYWRFKKNLLWFGDKCYHMIEHSFDHTLDDWKHLNQVLVPLISKRNKKEFFKECGDEGNKELTDDLLYSFCMATWLHDIGHKGSTHYGDPHLIRDNHGYIAGELILKYPEVFRIKDKDDYYKELNFSKVSAVEALYRRKETTKKQKLTISEMIALIAIYHKSNAPIDQESFHRLCSNPRKRIPLDYYKNKEPKYENILTLEKILEERDSERKERILTLTALFRFIDSIDLRVIRVGDITERELKRIVIENDKKYQYHKLAREVKNLSRHYTETAAESALFVKSFYDDPIEEIEKGAFVSLGLSKELIKDPEILANYESLIDYAAFIALQPDHFDLHSSVKEMRFEYIGDSHLSITLITDKDEEWLNEHKVRERGSEKQTIYDRLIGEDNYIFREIKDVKKYLKCFYSQITVMLMHESGEQYGERRLNL